jgi:hypothetical protein
MNQTGEQERANLMRDRYVYELNGTKFTVSSNFHHPDFAHACVGGVVLSTRKVSPQLQVPPNESMKN